MTGIYENEKHSDISSFPKTQLWFNVKQGLHSTWKQCSENSSAFPSNF
jgi:hypothetical protein